MIGADKFLGETALRIEAERLLRRGSRGFRFTSAHYPGDQFVAREAKHETALPATIHTA